MYDMNAKSKCYLGTVCLERTRWGKRQPSFSVSDWLPRFQRDGFDGIELWAYHFTRADEAEQRRLLAAAPIAIYNSYVPFTDEAAADRQQEAASISKLRAGAVKFNVGNDTALLSTYKRNLLAWAEWLPATCQLLCECHPGTLLETPDAAYSFHADLDPDRYGIIVHVGNTTAKALETWFNTFRDRVRHLHIQFRNADTDPGDPAKRPALDALFEIVRQHQFHGSVTMEFTRGIGKEENIESLYRNACSDMSYIRRQLSC